MILGIFFACTSEDPLNRPSAKTILEILDSHEIWHASTERWNRLGDERGVLQQNISVDGSTNAESEDSSNNSDSVIELSSDEEEEEDINNEESDDSSDIEILEEIPFIPGNKKYESYNEETGEITSKTTSVEVAASETETSNTKEDGASNSNTVSVDEGKLLDKENVKEKENTPTEVTRTEETGFLKNDGSTEHLEVVSNKTDNIDHNNCPETNNDDSNAKAESGD